MRLGLLLFFLFLSASPILDVEGNPNSSGHVLVIDIETDSDWSTIKLESNSSILFLESSIVTGEKIQEIENYHDDNDFLLIIKKKPYDTTPVAIKYKTIIQGKNPEINISIYKGFIGFTNLTINAYQDAGFHTIKSINHDNVISMPDINPLFTSLILQTPNDYSINLNTNPPEISKTVFACYYPWYESPNEINNRWKHWAPVSEQDIAFSPHFPMIGLYDSRDTSIYKAHINMGVEAGLDGFLCSWSGVNTTEDYVIEKMVQIATEYDFQIGIYYESFRGKMEPLKHDQIVEELSILINKYRGKPGYLHFLDLPVIFIYQAETANRTSSFWNNIFEEVRLKTGDAVFIGEFRQEQYFEEFDGVHLYNELDINIHEILMEKYSKKEMKLISDSWQSIEKELIEKNSLEIERLISVGTVVPGYDDREIRSPGQVLPRNELSTYRAYWDNVNENDLDWVIITSFNEWHEGTEIEPSLEYGFDYLVETKKQIAKFKNIKFQYSEPPILDIKLDMDNKSKQVLSLYNNGNSSIYCIKIEVENLGRIDTLNILEPQEIKPIHFESVFTDGGTYCFNVSYNPSNSERTYQVINYTTLAAEPGKIELFFEYLNVTQNDQEIEVSASMLVNSTPSEINYCSLDLILDDQLVYGECFSNQIINGSHSLISPFRINYTKKWSLGAGNHSIKLRGYARNNKTYEYKESKAEHFVIFPSYVIVNFTEILLQEEEKTITVEASVNVESKPSKISYLSIDFLINDTIIWAECWTDLTTPYRHYPEIYAPSVITSITSFNIPEKKFELSVRSYVRNSANVSFVITKKIYNNYEEPLSKQNIYNFMLKIMNKDRESNGLPPLILSSNLIAQDHAETMLLTKIFQHNSELPYGSSENIGMIKGYLAHYNITQALERLEYLMMYEDSEHNWQHRNNILNWNKRSVSLGIAYDDNYIYLVQDFFK